MAGHARREVGGGSLETGFCPQQLAMYKTIQSPAPRTIEMYTSVTCFRVCLCVHNSTVSAPESKKKKRNVMYLQFVFIDRKILLLTKLQVA